MKYCITRDYGGERYSLWYKNELIFSYCKSLLKELFPKLILPKKDEWVVIEISVENTLLEGRPFIRHSKNFLEVPCSSQPGPPLTEDDYIWDGEYFVNKHTIDAVKDQHREEAETINKYGHWKVSE